MYLNLSPSSQITNSEARKLHDTGNAERSRLYKDVFGDKMSDCEKEKSIKEYQNFLQEHVYRNGGQLRDYQAEGVAWMMANYIFNRPSILADEMGKSHYTILSRKSKKVQHTLTKTVP
jgi:SNF2 family DNA or RNA helicase